MNSMRDDVIGGFNTMLAEQQADGADAVMTLVQFDSQDAHEVVADAVPVAEMVPLSPATFLPRASTPLLDATGLLITKASAREATLAEAGDPAEVITFITITDGHENQSREYTRDQVRTLVQEREASGWSFAFLGAGLDSYSEARGMGYDARSVQAYAADGRGSRELFSSTSAAMSARRRKIRDNEDFDRRDFFEGQKQAEEDLLRRRREGRTGPDSDPGPSNDPR